MKILILSILSSVILYNLLLVIKTDNAYKNQMKILNAIDSYRCETEDYDEALRLLFAVEDMEETVWRLTDWGCKRILPKEDFELIKPYIK